MSDAPNESPRLDQATPAPRPGRAVSGPLAELFDELGSRGHDPLLRRATGSVRFDVVDGRRTDRWLLTIDKGGIGVSRRNAAADAVVRADKALFDGVLAGEANFMAALLRGEVVFQGDPRLVVLAQRLLRASSGRQQQQRPAVTRRKG